MGYPPGVEVRVSIDQDAGEETSPAPWTPRSELQILHFHLFPSVSSHFGFQQKQRCLMVFVCVDPKCWGPESILFGPTEVSTLLELRVLISSEHIVWHKLHPNGPISHVRAMILKASAICQGERSRIASSTPLCGRRQRSC